MRYVHRRTATGLQIFTARQGVGPLVEARLSVPAPALSAQRIAAQALLAATVAPTAVASGRDDTVQIYSASDYRQLAFSASSASVTPVELLRTFAETVYHRRPGAPVIDAERRRLGTELRLAAAYPNAVTATTLLRELYDGHPVSLVAPDPALVASVTAAQLAAVRAEVLRPDEATLVVVGAADPVALADAAEHAFAGWSPRGYPLPPVPPVPPLPAGRVRLLPRPGAAHAQLRLRAEAVAQHDPAYPALFLACNVFGAYTSSRLVQHLREEKGYVYGVACHFDAVGDQTVIVLEADTAAANFTAARDVIDAELRRMVTEPPTDAEIEAARRYALGSMATRLAARGTLASALVDLAAGGLDPAWLFRFAAQLRAVTTHSVRQAAQRFFVPGRFSGVVVGDPATTPVLHHEQELMRP